MSMKIEVIKEGEEYAPFYAIVDDEDYPVLSRFKWTIQDGDKDQTVYARTKMGINTILIHHLVMGTGAMIDHKNRIGLDNTKKNLRIATQSENQANAVKRRSMNGKKTSSKYKGVCWHKQRNKWSVNIGKNGKQIYLGLFESEEEAAKAYDEKARELFGEFARLNFPD